MAARARSGHYGGVVEPPPVLVEEMPPSATRVGAPCEQQNGSWIKMGLSLVTVMRSGDVPVEVREMRLAACVVCPHVTEANKRHYCECCRCPKWSLGRVGSDLEFKTTKAGWACPRTDPAYGQWSPEAGASGGGQ